MKEYKRLFCREGTESELVSTSNKVRFLLREKNYFQKESRNDAKASAVCGLVALTTSLLGPPLIAALAAGGAAVFGTIALYNKVHAAGLENSIKQERKKLERMSPKSPNRARRQITSNL